MNHKPRIPTEEECEKIKEETRLLLDELCSIKDSGLEENVLLAVIVNWNKGLSEEINESLEKRTDIFIGTLRQYIKGFLLAEVMNKNNDNIENIMIDRENE